MSYHEHPFTINGSIFLKRRQDSKTGQVLWNDIFLMQPRDFLGQGAHRSSYGKKKGKDALNIVLLLFWRNLSLSLQSKKSRFRIELVSYLIIRSRERR